MYIHTETYTHTYSVEEKWTYLIYYCKVWEYSLRTLSLLTVIACLRDFKTTFSFDNSLEGLTDSLEAVIPTVVA